MEAPTYNPKPIIIISDPGDEQPGTYILVVQKARKPRCLIARGAGRFNN